MWFGIVSIFPDLITNALSEGVVGRALEKGELDLEIFNPRNFAVDNYGHIDDRPFGGGPGMVMMAEPLARCVKQARTNVKRESLHTIYLTPQGDRFNQDMAHEFISYESVLLIAGRYEGVDQRFIDKYVDREVSLGDFVLSGGEYAALVILDTVGRLCAGTLNNPESVESESFNNGLLDHPQYTRPREFEGVTVPEILLSGDHRAVEQWRLRVAIERTLDRRPDLLLHRDWTSQQREVFESITSNSESVSTSVSNQGE